MIELIWRPPTGFEPVLPETGPLIPNTLGHANR